ncbi:Transmembrane emp24 domain-containing protein 9 [Entophlyctis sp. JEL0112]|nr:Transmembrane emp24 domain-containing protein 9 [Entophlyctis sp. JEL0112]
MRGAVALRLLVVWLFAAASANALYFILDGVEQKCFVEELPKDTTVLGSKRILLLFALTPARHTGKYTASAWNQAEGKFIENKNQVVLISVEKIEFDIFFGDVAHADTKSTAKQTVDDLAVRVRSLKYVVTNIFNEQKYQRDREAEFRNFSESINGKVVRWTLLQIVVLVVVGFVQTRYLQQFLVSKKII